MSKCCLTIDMKLAPIDFDFRNSIHTEKSIRFSVDSIYKMQTLTQQKNKRFSFKWLILCLLKEAIEPM